MASTRRVDGPAASAAERMAAGLLDADQLLQLGRPLDAVVRSLGISRSTYYRWRRRFDGVTGQGIARVRDLERENARLRRIVADQALAIEAMTELARGTY